MFLFKLSQQFLLPSVFLFVIIVAGIILIFLKRKKTFILGKILVVAGTIFYFLFSITPVADLILFPIEKQFQPINIESFNCESINKIVLLSGSLVERASEVLRLYNGLRCDSPDIPQIIISGVSFLDSKSDNEAVKTKQYLIERGILENLIIIEDSSRNTFESAVNIKELIDNKPFFLVTSMYHLPRSMEIFREMGTSPFPAPVGLNIKKNYNLFDIFPHPDNLEKVNLAFHEYFGIIYYKIKLGFQ